MALTPKNWASFQHYKNRSPAWIKLHRGLLDDFDFSRLPVASRALAPLLWLLASEYEDGCISASGEEIAFRLRMSVADYESALSPLVVAGFFNASDALAERKQSACLEKEGERREEKEGEREARARSVLSAIEKDFEPDAAGIDHAHDLGMTDTTIDAERRTFVDRKLSEGKLSADWQAEFRVWCTRWKGMTRPAESSAPSLSGPKLTHEAAIKQFAKTGIWSKHAPCGEPGQSTCNVPAELFAKYGLLPDGRRVSH